MKKRLLRMSVSLCLEFEAPFFVKVKAHLRHLGGKVVKVRQANNSTSDSMGGLRLSLFRTHPVLEPRAPSLPQAP